MWEINEYQVTGIGRTPGGNDFTELVDSLISAEAYRKGLKPSEIRTNLRTNLADGGVDTEVSQPISNDDTGWLSDTPTIWQYKAKSYSAKKDGTDLTESTKEELRSEIKKPYSSECIKKGYAYRLCICEGLPADVQNKIEDFLTEEAHAINPMAPRAKVLSAGHIAEWASRFPALKLRYISPGFTSLGIDFEAWGLNVTEGTHEFVGYPSYETISQKIKEQIDFTKAVPEAAITIQGLAGVGKTRLVYESLLTCDGAEHLSIITDDEKSATEIIRTILNDPKVNMILVADECGVSTRYKLNELLKGHKHRVRVVAIDNSGERPASSSPEIWLEAMSKEIIEQILDKNYPFVPIGRRRAYSDLAEGFIRFAAYLCSKDNLIASAGCVDPVHPGIRDYLLREGMFSSEELKVIQALSLVTKVGYKDDVLQELVELCSVLSIEPGRFKEVANSLHNTSGFVARAGRYYYVTPELIAQVGFDLAWNSWVKDDPHGFLTKLPKILLEQFYTRVRKSASTEVRGIIGDSFRRWSNELRPEQLNSVETIDRLVTLIEVEPGTYLPVLRRLIEQSTIDDLKKISGENILGSYGPRRSIVWLAERIIAFPEHFDNAENILLRLGLAESEKNIVNNATAIWKQLYRIYLSGTAVPFLDRLNRLKGRILSDQDGVSRFAVGAFDGILNDYAMRMAGPSIIAGRIPPEEYAPNDGKEYLECISATIALLRELINRDDIQGDIKQLAKSTLVGDTRTLLNQGLLDELKNTFPKECLNDNLRNELIRNIEEFLYFDIKAKWGRPALPEDYVEKVNNWLISLKPSCLKERISFFVGTLRGHYSILDNKEKLESEIKSLAKECLQSPENLMREEGILFSPDAKNAIDFGYGLGNLDEKAIFLDFVIESSVRYNSTEFGRGYISGLLGSQPQHADLINRKLDEIQSDYPALAYELFMTRIEITNAFERTLDLVDSGKLNAAFLSRFGYWKDECQLTPDNFEKSLQRLVDAANKGDSLALQAALEFVSFRIFREKEGKTGKIFDLVDTRSLAWRLIEITPEKNKSYQWIQTLEALSNYDLPRTTKIMALGLVEGHLHNIGEFDAFLVSLARSNPDLLMKSVGEVILDKTLGRKFQILEYKLLFKSLPEETVIGWVKEQGVEAARLIARHLPSPYVSKDGLPIVPHLTQSVLDTFVDDDKVFNAFLCGVHAYQIYFGDIAAQHDKEAEIASKFLSHSSRRIREWAQIEIDNALSEAERWRQLEEERRLD